MKSEQTGRRTWLQDGGHQAATAGQPRHVAATRWLVSVAGRPCSGLNFAFQISTVPTDRLSLTVISS